MSKITVIILLLLYIFITYNFFCFRLDLHNSICSLVKTIYINVILYSMINKTNLLDIFFRFSNMTKYMGKRIRNYSVKLRRYMRSFHCKCFACTSLSISKYCSIEAIENFVNNRSCHFIIHIQLFKFTR